MCGIAGFWNFRSNAPASGAVLDAMLQSLEHRGPDEAGRLIEGPLAIGMRRLRVIDPQGGRQPMPNEDGRVHVVFNGEIYNHADLRRALEARGHRFRSRSDTEVIVNGYEEWGAACVEHFNGMFAFAVWDASREQLLIARDRLGIKPLYVHEGSDGVVFGSELKAVIAAPWVPVEWDLEAVEDFLTYEYVPGPRSIVRAVSKLPAATTVLYRRTGLGTGQATRFWVAEAAGPPPASVAEAARGLRDRLEASVRRRLIADVPVGAFLSGGVDSTITVGLMAKATSLPVRTVSLGFADRSYDELPFARLAAQRFGTDHREALVTPNILDLARRVAGYFDEPFGDTSAFPTLLVSELARESVTVALSGDGGDELFAGYDHYRAHRWAARLGRLLRGAPLRVAEAMLDRIPPRPTKKGPINKAKRFVGALALPADLEHARWLVFNDVADRLGLYEPALAATLAGRDCFEFYRARLAEARQLGFEGLQRQLYADTTGYLADDILVKLDRMSMAVSLEARVPFLDHEVVGYAMSIPAEWKLRGGTSKWILKQAFRDILPPAIASREKQGFSIPMRSWLRHEFRPLVSELLAPERVRDRGWFRPAEVDRLVREHQQGRQNHAHRLWCLMSLELSMEALAARSSGRSRLVRAAEACSA